MARSSIAPLLRARRSAVGVSQSSPHYPYRVAAWESATSRQRTSSEQFAQRADRLDGILLLFTRRAVQHFTPLAQAALMRQLLPRRVLGCERRVRFSDSLRSVLVSPPTHPSAVRYDGPGKTARCPRGGPRALDGKTVQI